MHPLPIYLSALYIIIEALGNLIFFGEGHIQPKFGSVEWMVFQIGRLGRFIAGVTIIIALLS